MRAGIKARLFADVDDTVAADDVPGRTSSAPPTRIGRYVVIKRIGAGGMGVVYAAYDDKLDRKVAVKLLRPSFGPVSKTARQRLLREAQAIARLSHRCVVQVYEVGTHDEEVFVAMEYVEGSTLKQWQPSRDWKEILARYLDAGRGLCAAHAAGIVHRDFKADNVLVRASDLAVRVVDFGLARTERQDLPPDIGDATRAPEADASLTHTGLVMGTPAYMAPEQHLAVATDTRTDQFSFCASLFEALYGYRAFAGARLDELRCNVLAGKVEPAPRYTAVPPQVHQALARGLSVDPQDRHPTMEALLDSLELPRPHKPWRRVGVGLGAMVLLVGGSAAWSSSMADELSEDGQRLHANFDAAIQVDARAELHRLAQRTMPQRWNDLVLAFARSAPDPTSRLAALDHLTLDDAGALPAARAVASDALRGAPVFALRTTASPVKSVAFSHQGQQFVAVTNDGTLLHWASPETPTPSILATEVVDVAFDGLGQLHAIVPGGQLASIDPRESTVTTRSIHDDALTRVATDRQGRIALGASDGTVFVVNGDTIEALREHHAPVSALSFHPQKDTLASGDRSGRVGLWFLDRDTHRAMGIDSEVQALSWTHKGDIVFAQTAQGIEAWDAEQGTPTTSALPSEGVRVALAADAATRLERQDNGVSAVLGDQSILLDRSEAADAIALTADAKWAIAGHTRGVTLWRTGDDDAGWGPRGERLHILGGESPILAVHTRGGRLIVVTADGVISAEGTQGFETRVDLGVDVHTAVPSPDGRHVVVEASVSGALHLVDVDTWSQTRILDPFDSVEPGPLIWAPDGSAVGRLHCASSHAGCHVSLHPTDGSALASTARVHPEPMTVHVSPRGTRVALLHSDHLTLWDTRTGELQKLSPPPRMHPVACGFEPDGALRFASASVNPAKASLHVVRVDSDGDAHVLFERDVHRLFRVASAEGLVLKTHSGDNVLWTLRADEFVPLPDDLLQGIARPEFHLSPQGSRLWAGDEASRTVTMLDLDTGQREELPRPRGSLAWPARSVWVERIGPQTLREWGASAPHDAETFAQWLRTRTQVEIPVTRLQRTVSTPDEPL